jgi:enoyl-CoA hydratase
MGEGEPQVLVTRSGPVGQIQLNRPKALNSLTLDMVRQIEQALDGWEEDSDVTAVVATGAGERGFCAGGDIRAIHQSGRTGSDLAETFWREEYRLNARISRLRKPYVAVMDGITMGGGVGLSAHGSHRIVTERTRLAMPETGIGFFPNVGAAWLLSRAPGELGTFLGLTGQEIGAGDAIAANLSTFFVESSRLKEVGEAFSSLAPGSAAEAVSRVIGQFATTPPSSSLAPHRALIDRAFAFDDVEETLTALKAEKDGFADKISQTLLSKSPTSLKVTLRLLRLARAADRLETCLEHEFAATAAVLKTSDFYEGIRAAVLDKDRNPRWSPGNLAAVDESLIGAFFKPRKRPLFVEDEREKTSNAERDRICWT